MLNGGFSAVRCIRRGWRTGALVAGIVASLFLVIVGCSTITDGTPIVDAEEAPAYRVSVSVSISESERTSSERESSQQASLTTEAIHNSCDALSTSSVNAVRAVNTYVAALNGSGDLAATAGPAVQALEDSANLVSTSLSDLLEPTLSEALNLWVAAARGLADAIRGNYPTEQFNAEIDSLNDAKSRAVALCDAAY